MKITKLGHCCLVIEEQGVILLTDPGAYSTAQTEVKNVDAIIITHEHPDHFHIQSLKTVLQNNPRAEVLTNTAVGALLAKENLTYTLVEHGQSHRIREVLLEGFGREHAPIYPSLTSVQNTGYFINNKLFYPGDALYNPEKQIDVLALPVAGPWRTIAQAIEYALALKPRACFPVHDGMLISERMGPIHFLPQRELEKFGIKFQALAAGATANFE